MPTSVEIIDRHGDYGKEIVDEAKRARLTLPLACALVEQESDFKNIFGCDLGPRSSPPWCRQKVTRDRVQALLRHIREGGASNGVGLTQLTYPPFIERAERAGGAHDPRIHVVDGEQVTIYCQTEGSTVTGTFGTSDIWDRIGSDRYIADAYVFTGSDDEVARSC